MLDVMRMADLRNIIKDLPNDMIVIIPVFDEADINHISRFAKVRTAGILTCEYEEDSEAFCLSSSMDDTDIADQVIRSDEISHIGVKEVLYGNHHILKIKRSM